MEITTDIAVIGGGLTGSLMALASANSGFSVCIIDAISAKTQKDPDFDGRSYAIAMASGRMLKALGLWEDLEAGAQPILDIKVTDGAVGEHPSPFFLHFGKYPHFFLRDTLHNRSVRIHVSPVLLAMAS